MRILFFLARFVVGALFIFSGFVKGIDPWGSAYKFIDYFSALGIDAIAWSAYPLGMLLSFAEFFVGVGILFGLRQKLFPAGAMLFMLFFTPLTLWIAVANPVTDCGCFGDAWVISNWETFFKNLLLLSLSLLIWLKHSSIQPLPLGRLRALFGYASLAVYVIAVGWSARYEPIIDFRPFKVGVNIPEAMEIPPDAEPDIYEHSLYYRNKNSNEVVKFSDKDYPWEDTENWEFDRMDEPVLIKEGFRPAIKSFAVETYQGDNIADQFLYDPNYVFIVISHKLEKSSIRNLSQLNRLAAWATQKSYAFIGLTASDTAAIELFQQQTGFSVPFYSTDEIDLKTIIRSNPGLLVLKNGTIVGKFSHNNLPDPDRFE